MMNQPIYDNAANLSDREGEQLAERAGTQSDVILAFFRQNPGRGFTPWEVYHALDERYLIGSVRRAMNVMTKEGLLLKVEEQKKMEETGVRNNTWWLNAGQVNLFGMKN